MSTDAVALVDRLLDETKHYLGQRQYRNALPPAERAVQVARTSLSEQAPLFAASFHHLGVVYLHLRRLEEAVALLEKALSLRERFLGKKDPSCLTTLNCLGAAYSEQGRFCEATPLLQDALRLRIETLGFEHRHLGATLNNLAAGLSDLGRYNEAEPLYLRSLELTASAYGTTHRYYLAALNNLAHIYRRMGRMAEARQRCNELREILKNEPVAHPATLHTFAMQHEADGNYGEAVRILEEALRLRLASVGTSHHTEYAQDLVNLGELYLRAGVYDKADRTLREALAIYEELGAPPSSNLAALHHSFGQLMSSIGDMRAAGSFFGRATVMMREVHGGAHPHLAGCLHSLAQLYAQERRYREALPIAQEALDIRRRALGPDHKDVARSLRLLATVTLGVGDAAAAGSLYRNAMYIEEETIGPAHPDHAHTLNELALLYWQQRDYEGAERLMRQALVVVQNSLGDTHPGIAHLLNNLACLCAATDRAMEALALFSQASSITTSTMQLAASLSSDRQRMDYVTAVREDLDAHLSLLTSVSTHCQEDLERALELVWQRKGVVAELFIAHRDAVLAGNDPQLREDWEQLSDLRCSIARKTLEGPQGEPLETHLAQMRNLQAERERLEAEIARRCGPASNPFATQARVETVAAVLPGDAALVEFVRFSERDFRKPSIESDGRIVAGPARFAAFVVMPAQSGRIGFADLGPAEPIERLVEQLRTGFEREGAMDPHRDLDLVPSESASCSPSDVAAMLRNAILDPLLEAIKGCQSLYLAPDGGLALLPFDALPLMDGRYAIDAFNISYFAVGRDIIRSRAVFPGTFEQPLIVADPAYDEASSGLSPETIDDVNCQNSGRHTTFMPAISFCPLPGTRVEGEVLKEMLGGQLLAGRDALEGWIKKARCPAIFHIATHGFLLPDIAQQLPSSKCGDAEQSHLAAGRDHAPALNPLLMCGLALTGANAWLQGHPVPQEAEDGLLTAEDVSAIDLRGTELVCLSACGTGLGTIHNAEGILGLRRAFLLAGAKTLVVSLWRITEPSTIILMQRYYDNMVARRMRRDKSLREAKLFVRNVSRDNAIRTLMECADSVSAGSALFIQRVVKDLAADGTPERPFAHPGHWAAFVSFGCQEVLPPAIHGNA